MHDEVSRTGGSAIGSGQDEHPVAVGTGEMSQAGMDDPRVVDERDPDRAI